ncbi:MAG: hypothetical protein GY804_01065 [Alphaproteobacteria bacterium]|nr:hypothetical protein [Alphaproteobacteria bacterium]
MLKCLTKEQVIEHWDKIEEGLDKALGAMVGNRNELIKKNLLKDQARCWIAEGNHGQAGTPILYGYTITMITVDRLNPDARILFVYVVYGYENMAESIWRENIQDLRNIAKQENCKLIKGYTDNKRLIEVIKRAGFKEKSLVYLEV